MRSVVISRSTVIPSAWLRHPRPPRVRACGS
jgi:hypothetical protein